MSRKAAILGLGTRGKVWAEMFREAGWRVSGFDPDPGVSGLSGSARGWRRAETISACVASADWVVCCLPDRLELMTKVMQRAQAEAPDEAVIAVTSPLHDCEAIQGCAFRPSQIVHLGGDPGSGVALNVTARNTPDLKVAALAVLSEVCPSIPSTGYGDDAEDQSDDAQSA